MNQLSPPRHIWLGTIFLLLNLIALYGMVGLTISTVSLLQIILAAALILISPVLIDERYFNHRFAQAGLVVFAGMLLEFVVVRELKSSLNTILILLVISAILVGSGVTITSVWRFRRWGLCQWQNHRARSINGLILIAAIITNVLLVKFFNTLRWPYMYPRPLIFVLLAVIGMIMAAPEVMRGANRIRVTSLLVFFTGECYLLHVYTILLDTRSVLAFMHAFGVTGMFLGIILNIVNQFNPKLNRPGVPLEPGAELPFVAAIVPTYGEPIDVLERTLVSIKRLVYPHDRLAIIVSDDAHREELRQLAKRLGVHYNPGAQKDAKAGNLNSALDYIEQRFPEATLIVTQDADEILHPEFLLRMVGYFQRTPTLGFVQSPKEAFAPPNDPFGTRDRFFYDVTQVGRNGYGAAFACGSGVVWNIAALRAIGGFATWNVVEDLTTSYYIHAVGYESDYHPEVLSIGLAPDDIPGLLKQRGTWGVDNWRLFLFDNPLFKKAHFSLWQRLQYFELGMFHVVTAFFTPLVMLVPIISILTNHYLFIEGSALFPWVLATFIYYTALGQGKMADIIRMWQYWVGHSPTFIRAFFIAIKSRHKKPKYVVTRKTRQDGFYGCMVWPQFAYMGLAFAAIGRVLVDPPDIPAAVLLSNVATTGFFAFLTSAVCKASFYGVKLSLFPRVGRVVRQFIRQLSTASR